MSEYVSSIINKYGDRDSVPADCRILKDIQNRQGSSLILDCLASNMADIFIKMKLTSSEMETVKKILVTEFREVLDERT